jgi:N-acetylmuramoyl-L-alanine amidase
MRKWRVLLVLLGVLGLLALPALAQSGNAVVNTDFLNMRVGPGVQYERVATVAYGQTMTLIARDAAGQWVQGVLPTGVSGWVNAYYLVTTVNILSLPIGVPSQPTPPPQVVGLAGVVNTGNLNLRNGPAANFGILAKLPRGTTLTLTGRNGDARWVQVNVNGLVGWVSARYLLVNGAVISLPVISGTGVTPGYVEPVPSGGSSGIVTAGALNVRYGPNAFSPVLTQLRQGQGVNLAGRNATGTWLLVQLADGRIGWVNGAFISTSYPIGSLPIKG